MSRQPDVLAQGGELIEMRPRGIALRAEVSPATLSLLEARQRTEEASRPFDDAVRRWLADDTDALVLAATPPIAHPPA